MASSDDLNSLHELEKRLHNGQEAIKVLGGEIETLLASNQNGAPGGDPPSDPPPPPQGGERGRSRTQKRRGRRSSDQSRSSRSYSSNDSRSSRGSYSSGGSRSRSSGSRSYSSRSSRSSYSGDSRSRSRSRSGSRSGSSRSRSGSRSRSRSGSRSRSRSPTGSKESKNNRGSSSTPAKRNKRATVVKYRSPLYRTIAVVAALTKGKVDTRSGRDQTRKGRRGRPKERVVVSNFSRAPRFRENKAWVPGPGMYSTHDSSFTPRMVPKKPIIDGSDGLVWGSKEEELAKKKQRSKSKKGGDGKGKSKKKLAPGMTFSAANKVSTKAAAPPAPAPTQRGPASSAVLEAALKRERKLRIELFEAKKRISELEQKERDEQGKRDSTMAQLKDTLLVKASQLDRTQKRARALRESFHKVERANAELQRCIADNYPIFAASAAASRFLDIQSVAKEVAEAVNNTKTVISRIREAQRADRMSETASVRTDFTGAGSTVGGGAGGGAGARGKSNGNGTPRSPGGSPANVASFAKRALRASVAIRKKEIRSAEQEAAAARLHEQFGIGVDAKLTRRSESPSTPRGSTPRGTPRSTALARITQGGAASTRSPRVDQLKESPPVPGRLTPRSSSPARKRLASPMAPSQTSMDEKLQHIFKYYCSYGDRMNTTSMTNPKFFKFIRDAHILDTRVCPPDVDIVFNRACVRSAPGPKERTASPLRSTPVTNRLNYDRFVFAISELAVRKYQSDAAASLRQLVTLCVLPLYEKLRANPLFVEEIVQAGKETQVQQFAKAFLQKDVINFFNTYRVALQGLFTRYAMADTRRNTKSWSEVRVEHTRLSMKSFLKFCQSFHIMPEKLSRPDLVALFKQANQNRMEPDGSETPLEYPEFIELLGLLAVNLVTDDVQCPTPLLKVQMMFFNMHETGGQFEGQETKMVRYIVKQMKTLLASSKVAEDTRNRQTAKEQLSNAFSVLQEPVYA